MPTEQLPPVDAGGWRSAAACLSWGAGAISGGAAIAALLHANALDEDANRAFNTACPDGPQGNDPRCPQTTDDDRAVATWRNVALAGGIVAGAAVALGTWFYVTDDGTTLSATIGPASIGVRGAF